MEAGVNRKQLKTEFRGKCVFSRANSNTFIHAKCGILAQQYSKDCMKALTYFLTLNPLTALACKMSGLNDARTRLQTVYFPVL